MRVENNESTHITTGNIFDDLEFSPEEAAVLRIKTDLHIAIMKQIEERNLKPRDLTRILDVPQPRVSELMRGKISTMTIDKLAKFLHRLGQVVNVSTQKIPTETGVMKSRTRKQARAAQSTIPKKGARQISSS